MRESIRDNSKADFGSFKKDEYHVFNELASGVALIIDDFGGKRPEHLDPEQAKANLSKIIGVRGKGLKEYIEAYGATQAKQGNAVS